MNFRGATSLIKLNQQILNTRDAPEQKTYILYLLNANINLTKIIIIIFAINRI